MSQRTSVIRKKFFAEHKDPEKTIEEAKAQYVDAMLNDFDVDDGRLAPVNLSEAALVDGEGK